MMQIDEILERTKQKWNRYILESGEDIYQKNYIYRSDSKEEHYRMGYWDFPYFIAMPLARMGFELPKKILEIGVGTGRLVSCASHMVENVCGIDISEEVIKKALIHMDDIRRSNVELKVNDGQTIPYPDNTFDWVYSLIVFIHIPSKTIVRKYIGETFRVLKTGGGARIQLRYAGPFRITGKDYPRIDDNWDISEGCSWTRWEAYRLFTRRGFRVSRINRNYRNAWQNRSQRHNYG
jgi:SAM-dependent methyltransferase